MAKISEIWHKWADEGIKVPYVYDGVTKKPSITILFPYITFILAVVSVIALHFNIQLLVATTMTLVFWTLSVIFYMFRKLNTAKFDLDDKSFELSNTKQSGEDE